MTKNSEISPLSTLAPGDMAIRAKIEWRGAPAKPFVTGMQAVWVVWVSPCGLWVRWSNFRHGRNGGGEFRHTSHRRELISLSALENLSPTNAPLPELAASEVNPVAAA